ncbi:hypothetical protein Ae201684P_021237 [Aphanomyces euteiches]|nr:hypothetical protein Ae201684P_021237 [Aphanomyces euteiches]
MKSSTRRFLTLNPIFALVLLVLSVDSVGAASYCQVCTNAIPSATLYSHSGPSGQRSTLVSKSNGTLRVQEDGNVVVTSQDGQVVWASHTDGSDGQYLTLQDDSNLVLYGSNGIEAVWAANGDSKYKDPPFCLLFQQDNTLSVWSSNCFWIWRTGRDGLWRRQFQK